MFRIIPTLAAALPLVILPTVLAQHPGVSSRVRQLTTEQERLRIFLLLRSQPHRQIVAASRTRADAMRAIRREIQPEQDAVAATLARLGASDIERYDVLNLIAAEIPSAALADLEADPLIAQISAVERTTTQAAGPGAAAIGAPAFWSRNLDGAGKTIAVLDSGFNPALAAFNGVVSESKVFLAHAAGCPAAEANSPLDTVHHGVPVAAIIASQDAQNQGVAFKAGILSLKVSCSVGDDSQDIVDAVNWAIQNRPTVKVFNLSIGLVDAHGKPLIDPAFDNFFDQLADVYDITFAMAAGNTYPAPVPPARQDIIGSPALGYNVLSVANWDITNPASHQIDPTSNRGGGRKPDLAAPGNGYAVLGLDGVFRADALGTSFAAPHVAAAAALLAESGVTAPIAARALLLNSAWRDPATPATKWLDASGFGFLDLNALSTQLNTQTFSGKPVCQDQTSDNSKYKTICFINTIASSAAPPLLYKGPAGGVLNATLTWNRHWEKGINALPVSNLALFAYDAADGTEKDHATNNGGNAQVVTAAIAGDAVVKVTPGTGFFKDPALAQERYALALSSGFQPVQGPAITLNCNQPAANVPPGQPFQFGCTVTNTGDLPAFNATAQLFIMGPGQLQKLGTLGVGASQSFTVNGLGPPPFPYTDGTVNVVVGADGYGWSWGAYAIVRLQPDCTQVKLSSGGQTFGQSGGTGSFEIFGSAQCITGVGGAGGWVTITSKPASGPGVVKFKVDASPDRNERMMEIGVSAPYNTQAVWRFTVDQNPQTQPPVTPCTYTLTQSAAAIPFAKASGSVTVNTANRSDCSWTAAKDQAWATFTSNTVGQGGATVSFTAADNIVPDQSTLPRTVTLTVTGPTPAQTFKFTQAGLACKFALSKVASPLPKAGMPAAGPLQITVTTADTSTQASCLWTAPDIPADAKAWIHLAGNANGHGGDSLTLAIDANTGAQRSLTIHIAGIAQVLTQEAADAAYTVSGKIVDTAGHPVANVPVVFLEQNVRVSATNTDKDGKFSQGGFKDKKNYVATPILAGAGFLPESKPFAAATTTLDFTAFVAFTASGKAMHKGKGLAGVTLTFVPDQANKATFTATTDANGDYSRTLEKGVNYTCTPVLKGYNFTAEQVTEKHAHVNFNAK